MRPEARMLHGCEIVPDATHSTRLASGALAYRRFGAYAGEGMKLEDARVFCREFDSIDELVDQINSDGSAVISEPADMAVPLERLAAKFNEVADAAPTEELAKAFREGCNMFSETASKLREFPPEAAVAEAAEISTRALARVEELTPPVVEFREKYCGGSRDE